MSDKEFQIYSSVLKSLTKIPDISLFEIYQTISHTNTMSYDHDDDDEWCNRKQDIFNLLLDISCFNNKNLRRNIRSYILLKI